MNLIECCFSILTRQGLTQSVHQSKRQLKDFLLQYIDNYNQYCTPFVWTKGPEKLQRIIEATQQYQLAHPPQPRKRRKKRRNIKKN